MKKIYLLKIRYIEWWFFIFIGTGWIITVGVDEFDEIFLRVSNFGYSELVWGIIITFGAPVFLIVLEWLNSSKGRELTHTIIDENGYQAYLFRKKYCYVDKRKDIYYVVYYYPYYRMRFIAFSNEPFKMFQSIYISKKIFAIPYIFRYDFRKVILLPYNEKTMMEFDIENWKKAEYIKYGQYNWKTRSVEVRKEEEDC